MEDSSSPPPEAGGTQVVGGQPWAIQVVDLDRRLSVVERAIVSMADDIRDIKAIVIRQDAEIRGIKEILAEHSKRFEQIDRRFERVDQRFEQIDRRFEQVDQQFGRLSGEVGVMHGELQKVTSLQERHGIELTKMMKRLELDNQQVDPGR